MIIKTADDRRQEIAALRRLLAQHGADERKRAQIEQLIRRIAAGIRGEEDAAYEMRVHWGDSPDWMIIHDLRIRHEGLTAQMDHLIINRWLEIWVCESKRVSQGISINPRGEFTVCSDGKPRGIPSPIEQVRKQALILRRVLEAGRVELPKRLGFTLKPEVKELVLVSRNGRISRPKVPIDGLDCIIKADQLRNTVEIGLGDRKVSALARIVSQETLERFARALAALHQPARHDWAGRLQRDFATAPTAQQPWPKRTCDACGAGVSQGVAQYCRSEKRFDGRVYCLTCQRSIEHVLVGPEAVGSGDVTPFARARQR